jgi:hypothetical protein
MRHTLRAPRATDDAADAIARVAHVGGEGRAEQRQDLTSPQEFNNERASSTGCIMALLLICEAQ